MSRLIRRGMIVAFVFTLVISACGRVVGPDYQCGVHPEEGISSAQRFSVTYARSSTMLQSTAYGMPAIVNTITDETYSLDPSDPSSVRVLYILSQISDTPIAFQELVDAVDRRFHSDSVASVDDCMLTMADPGLLIENPRLVCRKCGSPLQPRDIADGP